MVASECLRSTHRRSKFQTFFRGTCLQFPLQCCACVHTANCTIHTQRFPLCAPPFSNLWTNYSWICQKLLLQIAMRWMPTSPFATRHAQNVQSWQRNTWWQPVCLLMWVYCAHQDGRNTGLNEEPAELIGNLCMSLALHTAPVKSSSVGEASSQSWRQWQWAIASVLEMLVGSLHAPSENNYRTMV